MSLNEAIADSDVKTSFTYYERKYFSTLQRFQVKIRPVLAAKAPQLTHHPIQWNPSYPTTHGTAIKRSDQRGVPVIEEETSGSVDSL